MAEFSTKTVIVSHTPEWWSDNNNKNILGDRQLGVSWNKDLNVRPILKQGDGVHHYDELPEFSSGSAINLIDHIERDSEDAVMSSGIYDAILRILKNPIGY